MARPAWKKSSRTVSSSSARPSSGMRKRGRKYWLMGARSYIAIRFSECDGIFVASRFRGRTRGWRIIFRTRKAGLPAFLKGGFRCFCFFGIDPGILRNQCGLRRQRQSGSGAVEGLHDVEQQVFLSVEKSGVVALENVGEDFHLDEIVGETNDADACGGIFDLGVNDEHIVKLAEHVADMVGGKVVA